MALYLLFWLKKYGGKTNISHKVKTLLDVDCVCVCACVFTSL